MKKALVLSIILANSVYSFCQCNQHFNGSFEATVTDSIYNKYDSLWEFFYLPAKCFSEFDLISIKDTNNRTNPDTVLLSTDAYDGDYALAVHMEWATVSFGNSFIRDTFSSKVNGLNGYYKTDSLFKTSELLVSFLVHNTPSDVYRNQTADTLMIETFLLEPTNGNYKYFEIEFDRNRNVLKDSFILSFNWIINFDNQDETTNEFVLFDKLSFDCPTAVNENPKNNNLELLRTENGYIVETNQFKRFHYQLVNLNGRILEKGQFINKLQINFVEEIAILQVTGENVHQIFKLIK